MAETAFKQSTVPNSVGKPGKVREVRVIQPIAAAPLTEKIPTAAYVRVSSSSADQLNSYAAQLKYYRETIAGHEYWQLVDIYAGEGITGTSTLKREAFHRLMADCRKGKVKWILVKSISRFCRNTLDCLTAVLELSALGVSVYFEKEGIDTAGMKNELFLTILGSLAQQEKRGRDGVYRCTGAYTARDTGV